MSAPIKAFEFLSAEDEGEAERLVRELGRLNDQRKGFVASIIKEIKHRFAREEMRAVLVAGNPAWHPGLLGLAANTLMEEFARPVFLWGGGEVAVLKGSCRSDGSVSIVELMRRASAPGGFSRTPPKPLATERGAKKAEVLLADFGGHEFSGGFSVSREEVHKLPEALARAYMGMERKTPSAVASYDEMLSLDEVNGDLYRMLEMLAPYGEGNPKPLFLFEKAEVIEKTFFGKTKNHAKLLVRGEKGTRVPAIKFFADRDEKILAANVGETISFLGHVERNIFGNKAELRVRIVEIKNEK